MDPDFRIGDEGELRLLEVDVLNEFLEECYEEGREEFLDFVEAYGTGKSDGGIVDYILQVYRFANAAPSPSKWLEQAGEYLAATSMEELENQPWVRDMVEEIHLQANELLEQSKQAEDLCKEEDGPDYYLAMILSDRVILEDLLKSNSFVEAYRHLKNMKFVRKPVKRNATGSEELKEQVSIIRDAIKTSLKDMEKQFASMEEEDILEGIQNIRQPMFELIYLVKEYDKRFTQAKREKNILDFSDIEHLALQILTDEEGNPTRAANELKEQFEEILIDEYQDSNYLQEAILDSISRRRDDQPNTFMVGDVKQSIYRFRMARPELFQEKYETYTKEDSLYQRIDLHQNFRSRKEILEGINVLFEQIMTSKMGNVQYDDDAALHLGASYPERTTSEPAIELLLADTSKEVIQNLELEESSSQLLEGQLIAKRIKELTDSESGLDILDKESGKMRKATNRDIVILLRSFSGWAQEILQVLLQEGIPAYAQSSTGYFDALEIQTVLNLLKVIDNPRQDLPLAGVLKSPFVGCTSMDLAEIVAFYKNHTKKTREKGLYFAVLFYCKEGEKKELQALLANALDTLERYRKEAIIYPVHELLYRIFSETGYYDYVSALPAGSVRQANLDMLVQKAVTYATTSYHGLFHFVRYIENLQKYEVDYAPGSNVSEQDDLVRITSIHKSKGLEYPIVIVAGMSKMMNRQDSRAKILLHPDFGISADFIDSKKRLRVPTLSARAFSRKIAIDNSSEELRILYVALTRAKEKLILTACDSHLETRIKKWKGAQNCSTKTLPFTMTSKANSYLDWMLMALQRGGNDLIAMKSISMEELVLPDAKKEMDALVKQQELEELDSSVVYSKEMKERIERYLRFEYPYLADLKLHSKFTVSEIKKMYGQYDKEETSDTLKELEEETEVLNTLPTFMKKEQEQVDKATRGTMYHKVLEVLDETKTYHTDVIREQLENEVKKGRLDAKILEVVNLWDIYRFYQSDLGKRVILASKEDRLYKEQPFIMTLPAKQVKAEWDSDEPILIQGIIDIWFEEEDGIVLMDYKTDRVDKEETLIRRYQGQFRFYKKALEQLTGKKVKESYIYSFALQKEIVCIMENL
jgi:ATP-dependent helicase/nuclease subunit A